MAQSRRRRSPNAVSAQRRKAGHAPGSPVYSGPPQEGTAAVRWFVYGPHSMTEGDGSGAPTGPVVWTDLVGVHDAEAVRALCDAREVHPLALEDALNPAGRPKAEHHGSSLFVSVRVLDVQEGAVTEEQVSFVLGDGWLLSFQERPGDVFDPVRERIRTAAGRLRSRGADYLLHALLDAAVDRAFVGLEFLEDQTDALETRVAVDADATDIPGAVFALRAELMGVRRALWPLREVVAELLRAEAPLVKASTLPYFRDLHDHVLQAIDVVDSGRDRLVGVLELHLAMVTHRMNEVMRTLTIVATIFIPLTFVAGIYGMNFQRMPELGWRFGYPAALLGMFGLAAGMVAFMRRRGWWA